MKKQDTFSFLTIKNQADALKQFQSLFILLNFFQSFVDAK